MIRRNVSQRQIVILILARLFDRLSWTGSTAKVHLPSSGFTDLLVQVKQLSFRQLQSFFAVNPSPIRILGAVFFF